jgi:hypothetical protein
MFCVPPNKEVTTKEADEIIMQQANAIPDADKYPISILLLAGLTDTFPCNEQKTRVRAHRRAVEPTDQSEPERKKRFKRGAGKSTPEKHRKTKS